jgi:hypothetical protein
MFQSASSNEVSQVKERYNEPRELKKKKKREKSLFCNERKKWERNTIKLASFWHFMSWFRQ